MKADDVVAVARSFVGTPFKHRGRQPGVALDCAGVALCSARELSIEHFDVEAYGRTPVNGLLDQTLADQPALVAVADPGSSRAGDILLMRFGRHPTHVAILAGDTIIHSYESVGQVCEHRFTREWQARVVKVFRFSGIEP